LRDVSIVIGDMETCSLINSNMLEDNCVFAITTRNAILGENVDVCFELNDSSLSADCVAEYAIEHEDDSVCGLLGNSTEYVANTRQRCVENTT